MKDLTQGKILKNLLLFALPMIMGNLLQQVYNIADTLIVGRFLGAEALAAVGSAYTLMVFLASLVIGLCMGSGALFSMDFGAGKPEEMKADIGQSALFIGAVTLLIYLIVFPGTDLILHLLQVPEDVYPLMRVYVRIIFIGIAFTSLYNFFAYILRSVGNSAVPLIFLAVSSVLNVALDIFFITVLGFGVGGAAAATVISQMVSGVGIAIFTIRKIPEVRIRKEHLRMDARRMKRIIRNDILTGMQQSVMNFGILMIQGLVNSFGTVVMAAFAAAVKIDSIAYLPAVEFANAYSLFISQNYGAKKMNRIRKGTMLSAAASVVFCLISSTIVWCLAKPLMGWFIDAGETEIVMAGVHYLHIEGACYFGIGLLSLFYGFYRGVDHPGMSLVLTIISLGTRVLLSYTLAPNTPLGVTAIWLSIPIGWGLADLAGFIRYRFWKKNDINLEGDVSNL